jgi:hypothetical protein
MAEQAEQLRGEEKLLNFSHPNMEALRGDQSFRVPIQSVVYLGPA